MNAISTLKPPTRWLGINRRSEQARGLVGLWPALASAGCADTHLRDLAGEAEMTQSGATNLTWDSTLGVGTSVGPGNYMTGSDAALPNGAQVRTIAQWVRVDVLPTIDQYTFSYGTLTGNQWLGIGLFGYAGGNYLNWFVSNAAAAAFAPAPLGARLGLYHLCFTYGGGTAFTFYVNGADTGATGWPGGALNTSLANVSMCDYQTLAASIFDTRVYNRVLSAGEVARLYDPRTRWDLYRQPSRFGRKVGSGGGGGFNAGRIRRQQLIGSGVY